MHYADISLRNGYTRVLEVYLRSDLYGIVTSNLGTLEMHPTINPLIRIHTLMVLIRYSQLLLYRTCSDSLSPITLNHSATSICTYDKTSENSLTNLPRIESLPVTTQDILIYFPTHSIFLSLHTSLMRIWHLQDVERVRKMGLE